MPFPGIEQDQIAEEIIRIHGQEFANRGTWHTHWQEIADRMYPQARRNFVTDFNTKGEKLNQRVFDSTAVVALGRFAAILDSLLTPRNQTWHRLVPSDDLLSKDRQVRLWLDDVNRMLFKHRYAPGANFASQNQMNFKGLGAFGTSAMFIDASAAEKGLRYKNCHLGQIFIMENHQGVVDKVIRSYRVTARQALQQWGDGVPDAIRTAYEKEQGREFEILHYVGPRHDLDPGRFDFKGMPWVSYYVSVEGKQLMSEGGHTTFPYAVSRYEQAPTEKYGRSPAMDVLPAIKTLNEQKKTLLKQGHRVVDPVLLVHDDGILDTFSLKPGATNAGGVSKDGKPLVHTLPTGNISAGVEMMEEERRVINDAFLVNIFQILTENPQMTATEVLERTREKGILLAPTLGRIQSERLGPQIEREIDVLGRQGMLPPMPDILREAGGEFKTEYDSPLSRAQRAEEASGLMRTVESTLGIVNTTGDQSPLDHFNWDVIVPDLSEINAVPARWMSSAEQIKATRQNRAQQQQQRQAIEAAPAVAGLAKTVGQT